MHHEIVNIRYNNKHIIFYILEEYFKNFEKMVKDRNSDYININYLRQGIGSIILNKAINLSKDQGVKYLRLFAVDINHLAINFYIKNGFKRAAGIYNEIIDDNSTLHEY